ncbi:hypothetical protein [Enterobacter mori]|uniref:hypothetical protein n=1 Tax=Enterobacter mori TaxID=539813 RepID=UPI001B8B6837|nr:hypothetical protein [Enterobacter mori]
MILSDDRLKQAVHYSLASADGRGVKQAISELDHTAMVFNGDLNLCNNGAVHVSGPLPNLREIHGNLVIEEGKVGS